MQKHHVCLGLAFLLWIATTTTGVGQDYSRQYKTAKDFFLEGSYGLAMEAFKPLVIYDAANPYSQYASFYYALSAFHQGFPAVSKDMLLQIKKLYPSWDQMEEVDFWLARIYFDDHNYFQALRILSAIRNEKGATARAQMKEHYLGEVKDVETLRMMLEEYPDDISIARLTAKAILSQPFLQQDHHLLDSLVARYGLERSEFDVGMKPENKHKERYRVALLFPFLSESLEPTPGPKRNQSILDLYTGMRMALDTLSAEGIHVDLLDYDTERDTTVTKELLGKPEMKYNDLIVGPLFTNQLRYVQEFSVANKINMINPVSPNPEYLGENPFAILYQPSYETVGRKSADFLNAKMKNKNCMVFMGDTPRDSVMAFSFIQRARELNLSVVYAQEVNRETAGHILEVLATPTEYDEYKNPIQFETAIDSIGSIFVASDDPLIYTKAISAVDTRGDSIVIVGNETWLEGQTTNFDTYERLQITLTSPNFTSASSRNYLAFRKKFILEHGLLPSTYVRLGFEFMWFIGHALHDHGVYFQDGLAEQGLIPGFLSEGYDYSGARDNQHVPFIHFQGGELKVLDWK